MEETVTEVSQSCSIDFSAFNQWCSEYSWVVTLISVFASAMISLYISKRYFDKANRISAITSIVEEIHSIISAPVDKAGSIEFNVRKNLYCSKFLKQSERSCIDQLYDSYVELLKYDAETVAADAVVQWYHNVLRDNSINIEIWPFRDSYGNTIDWGIPDDADCKLSEWICTNLKMWADYQIDPTIEDKLNVFLNVTTNTVFGIDKIEDYFVKETFENIVQTYENIHWGERFAKYHSNKDVFYQLFPEIGGISK